MFEPVARKYCTSCSQERIFEGGEYKQTGRIKRWKCLSCLQAKSPSIFASKSKQKEIK